jgi:glycosyltransferase involved in cell wall biosynthesis
MRRVLFLNRFFTPDHSATSQLLGDVATDLATRGYDVHVVTSRQLYDDPKARLPAQAIINGVQVHRVATSHFGRSRLPGRAVDYLSFYVAAWRALLRLTRPRDILVAMTDPPLISLVAMRIAKHRDAVLVNWLQDLYPEVAVALNVPVGKGPLLRIITYLRDRSLRVAAANVVVGSLMADKVEARGVARDHIHVITNWAEDQKIVPIATKDNLLRRQLGLGNQFVVGYSGNLGRAHEFETVLAAAERLRNEVDIVFLCIGGGHLMAQLVAKTHERGLTNFQFRGYQDQAALQFSLSVPDVHWVSLRPELEGLIVPSKIYGIAAAGRPIIAICARDGEISRLVEQHQCGVIVQPGDAGALVESILRLSRDTQLRAKMGRQARAMLENNFTRQQALQRWQNLLNDLINSSELQTRKAKTPSVKSTKSVVQTSDR